ncbi:hypothetical protein [Streptomyces sp. NBC_01483]|uniref:hypothetical protein n=1 Tax=Streptomyces sp. NBC_01483 TaxID=2903883 RepID=UPI002E372E3C|nr:hypothetical protein [Streptomyces sp. NBC_01483]
MSAALFVSGCSGSSGEEQPAGVAARQLCDGTLDAEATAAVERLSGTKQFTELTGTNESGEPNKFSVARAVKHLHDETTRRSRCNIYKASGDNDFPVLQIQFYAAKQHPQPLKEATRNLVPFAVGTYAATGTNGADLYFACTTGGTANSFIGNAQYVKGEMTSSFSALRSTSDAREHMVILNSVARAVAAKAGCAAEARLPAKVPAA